jgi:hypothetical protein
MSLPRWLEHPPNATIMNTPDKEAGAKSQNDSPDKDEYHDENRRNGYDPEVAEDIGADEEERP